ncbi:hypothetical protein F3Y22_tig00007179pilonHSYRG00071 [Hibiscus syriacus]|uniref:FAD-binding domain-containing protein n=1 Tax=Hibiscus syriacus TaxID=106335 RepID=A0A6A3CC65_HIBSY|nr:hypothetical protein F3Y22_tig00007179pilonHSYRG00071 [Hibiscus syriacus]
MRPCPHFNRMGSCCARENWHSLQPAAQPMPDWGWTLCLKHSLPGFKKTVCDRDFSRDIVVLSPSELPGRNHGKSEITENATAMARQSPAPPPGHLAPHYRSDDATKESWTLTRGEEFNFRAAHWADLHGLLYNALSPDVFFWGHQFISFTVSEAKSHVKVKVKLLRNNNIVEIDGYILIAADGCLSLIRQHFLPDLKLRYSGYCACRGVLDFSGKEDSETIKGIRKAEAVFGKCLENWGVENLHSALEEYSPLGYLLPLNKCCTHGGWVRISKACISLTKSRFDPKKASPNSYKIMKCGAHFG